MSAQQIASAASQAFEETGPTADVQSPAVSSYDEAGFAARVAAVTDGVRDMLIAKNAAYGDSALSPVRIFSKASPVEQILVRLDDKLSRLARGHEYPGDDTIHDILGYLVLLLLAKGAENVD